MQGGGAERVAALLCNYWVEQGHYVTLVPTYSGRGQCLYELNAAVRLDYLADHVRFHKIPILGKLIRLLALRTLIKNNNPDVIISFLSDVNIATLLATKGLDLTVIVSERTYQPMMYLGIFLESLRKITYPWATSVVVQTQEAKQWQKNSTPKANVRIISNPLTFPLPNESPIIPPTSIIQDDFFYILAVGRLSKEKGQIDIIHAMVLLLKSHPKTKLIILGEGDERPTLEIAISKLNLHQHVKLVGHVGNLHDWYQSVDLYVMSSHFEGFPNSLLEAMAYGLPCVSYDCPVGPRNLIQHGLNGLLVPLQESSNGLYNAISSIIKNPILRKNLGENAQSVKKNQSITNISQKWQKLFDI